MPDSVEDFDTMLESLRSRMDYMDRELIRLLARRNRLMERILRYKLERGLSVRDPDREREILDRCRTLAREEGLSGNCVTRVWRALFSEAGRYDD